MPILPAVNTMTDIVTRAEAKAEGLLVYFTGAPCRNGHISVRQTSNGVCRQCTNERRQTSRARKPGYKTRAQLDAKHDSVFRECTACHGIFQANVANFQLLKRKKDGIVVGTGWSAECRTCRNKRYTKFYITNRRHLIRRATESTRKRRERPEVRERERVWARDHKRKELADPIEREKHNARGREWRRKNPDRVKLFRGNQPHMRRMRTAQRMATELQATPPWAREGAEKAAIEAIYAQAYQMTCETGIAHDVDHYWPLRSKYVCGLHIAANLRVVVAGMNQSKGNKLPEPIWDDFGGPNV
jgi:hypothetical protein